MKICVGYYDKDGKYIGDSLDNPKRKKFFVVMGKMIKKISEHEAQSPYKNHRKDGRSKTYCDQNRLNLYVDVYINGKLNNTITDMHSYWYWDRDEYKKKLKNLIQTIFKHVKDNKAAKLAGKYKIDDERKIYFPLYV